MEFTFEFLDSRRILMLHGENAPPAADWRAYLRCLEDKDVASLGLLVFTNGGAPDVTQRSELNRLLCGRYFARAIVHRSAIVRGVVAAVGWFAPGVAAFHPNAWHAAAAHAGILPAELELVERTVKRLHGTLGEPIPWLDTVLDGAECPPSVTRQPVSPESTPERPGQAASGPRSARAALAARPLVPSAGGPASKWAGVFHR
jgi:hypothetical protein